MKLTVIALSLFFVSCASTKGYQSRKISSVKTELKLSRFVINQERSAPAIESYLSFSDIENDTIVDDFYRKFKSNGVNFNVGIERIVANLKAIQLTRSALMEVTPFHYNQLCYYGDPEEAVSLLLKMESRKTREDSSIIGADVVSGYVMFLLKANRHKKLRNTIVPSCT